MESTVLSPGPGQSVVSSSHGWPYGVNGLDSLIVAEQAAYGRQQAEFAADIQRTVKDSEANLQAFAGERACDAAAAVGGTNARIERSAADTADRVNLVHRGLSGDIDDAEDGLHEHLSNFERSTLTQFGDVRTELQSAKSKILRKMAEDHGAIMLESAKQYADLKATIIADGAKTRDQAAEYRMRSLEQEVAKLNLVIAAKP